MEKKVKIFIHIGDPILCGGILIPCQYIGELRKRGYEAYGVSEGHNEALEKYMGTPFIPMSEMQTTDDDIIIAVRWEECEMLEKYKGKKFQFVQGRDEDANCGEDWKIKMRAARNNKNWELIGVSDFCLKDWGRGTVVPNFIDKRFFMADMEKFYKVRDIDALIEGNNEPNKNIDYAIQKAKEDGHKKIVWFGRETVPKEGVENISSPPQEEIPKLYQRAKHFYKYSKSEGFCLPLAEAMVSGCECHFHDMGGNDFKGLDFKIETSTDKLIQIISK